MELVTPKTFLVSLTALILLAERSFTSRVVVIILKGK